MTKISDSHIRVIIKSKQPAQSSQNKNLARKLQLQNHANSNQANVMVKRWTNNRLIKDLRNEIQATRNAVDRLATAPDLTKGAWLVHGKHFQDLLDEANTHKARFHHLKQQAVSDYTNNYDNYMENEEKVNGDLVRGIQYPSPKEFEKMWDLDVLLDEIEPGSFLAKVEQSAYNAAEQELSRTNTIKEEELRSHMRDSLVALVNQVVNVLENNKRITTRTFNQLKYYVENFSNPLDDKDLKSFVDSLSDLLKDNPIETVKTIPSVKEHVTESYKLMMNEMENLF